MGVAGLLKKEVRSDEKDDNESDLSAFTGYEQPCGGGHKKSLRNVRLFLLTIW